MANNEDIQIVATELMGYLWLQQWYRLHRQSQRRRVLCNSQSTAPILHWQRSIEQRRWGQLWTWAFYFSSGKAVPCLVDSAKCCYSSACSTINYICCFGRFRWWVPVEKNGPRVLPLGTIFHNLPAAYIAKEAEILDYTDLLDTPVISWVVKHDIHNTRAETYPAGVPRQTNSTIAHVIKAPLFAATTLAIKFCKRERERERGKQQTGADVVNRVYRRMEEYSLFKPNVWMRRSILEETGHTHLQLRKQNFGNTLRLPGMPLQINKTNSTM
ncbi:hypothetical protein C0J52_06614 [Blattella germanica]|nr:hypothetical protein C0J52_06614 [Blattella germanica]